MMKDDFEVTVKTNGTEFKAGIREWTIAKAAAQEVLKSHYTHCPIIRQVQVLYGIISFIGIGLLVKIIWG